MPPKKKKAQEAASKKAEQKKKNKIIEDKTFGLKNKNKSKKVQAHIQSVTKNVMNSNVDRKTRLAEEAKKQRAADAKARRKAQKAEQNLLFNEALSAVKKKGNAIDAKAGKTEAKGRDGDEDGNKKNTSRAMKMMYQMDAKEMEDKLREDPNYVPTLEDEIEMQRQKKVEQLKASGKKGTPITEKSFAEWRERKRQKRAEESKKLVEREMRKKKGGKGLAVLSGRDLYEYKASLFEIEDEDIADAEVDGETKPTANGESTTTTAAPLTANDDDKISANGSTNNDVEQIATKVQSDLFLEGDDDDLDDIEDD